MSPHIQRSFRAAAFVFLAAILLAVSACKRSEDALDDRTLEKRSHVETVKPEDRKDAFRP